MPLAKELAGALDTLPAGLVRDLRPIQDRLDLDRIARAYALAEDAHRGQKRASGEPYVNHASEVAAIVGRLRLDTDSIAAALLHDVVEDTPVALERIREICGPNVGAIVDGLTKIGRVRFRTDSEQQVENYRKLLLSMAEDARVILVKLADRLHNMRTLEHLPRRKRAQIARETMEIYSPIAHRLGIGALKWELEDLAFKFLDRTAYDNLRKLVRQRRKIRESQVEEMRAPLVRALAKAGIPSEVEGRPKHLWSIHRKMEGRKQSFDEIYDLMALRIVTGSVKDCYGALGVVHSKWQPIQERFHDYVATPKSNRYQSIHTTVFGPKGRRYEVQIRTREMHSTAEYGIAAHWRYKQDDADGAHDPLVFFRRVVEWHQDAKDPEEFMEFLKMDLFTGEIFVFTPMGDLKQLPEGSTPIDFAFSVHTEVGLHCASARVNGRIAPLSRKLKSGDTVQVVTRPGQTPNPDWLAFVRTTRAKQQIRRWVRREEFGRALRMGRELFARALRKAKRRKPRAEEQARAARSLKQEDFDQVLAGLARGDFSPQAVIGALYPGEDPAKAVRRAPSTLERIATRIRQSNKSVTIQGVDNLMVRYSKCCQPLPGDDVVGYISRGRGISIHRADCPNLLGMKLREESGRRVEIEWKAEKKDRFYVRLVLEGTDRRGLLRDVANKITDTDTDIRHANMLAKEGGMAADIAVGVRNLRHLKRVISEISRVKGVVSVARRGSFQEEDLS